MVRFQGAPESGPTPLGRRIREARQAIGLSYTKLAECAGVNEDSVRKIETGAIGDPRIGTVRAIAEALGVTIDSLVAER